MSKAIQGLTTLYVGVMLKEMEAHYLQFTWFLIHAVLNCVFKSWILVIPLLQFSNLEDIRTERFLKEIFRLSFLCTVVFFFPGKCVSLQKKLKFITTTNLFVMQLCLLSHQCWWAVCILHFIFYFLHLTSQTLKHNIKTNVVQVPIVSPKQVF